MPPKNPQVEFEAFIRWLATNPHKHAEYEADPQGFLAGSDASEVVKARVQAIGADGLRAAVQADKDKVASSIEDPNFGRTQNVQGYGARRPSS